MLWVDIEKRVTHSLCNKATSVYELPALPADDDRPDVTGALRSAAPSYKADAGIW